MAGCYGPLSGIYCINESADSMPVFRASVKKFFPACPQGFEPHALTHAYSRPPSVIPARVEIQGVSKTGPDSVQTGPRNAPELHSNLHELCTKRALVVRFEDFTHPTRQTTGDGRASSPRRRESRGCQKPIPSRRGRMSECPPKCTENAFKCARTMHQTCTRGALRRLHAPDTAGNPVEKGWIPASAGTTRSPVPA